MKQWLLSTKYKKSIIETEEWTKEDLTILHTRIWRWGSFVIECDEKPDIDLKNPDGLNIYESIYDIDLYDLSDGDNYFDYPESISEDEIEKLESIFEEWSDCEQWSQEGWTLDNQNYELQGELTLEELKD